MAGTLWKQAQEEALEAKRQTEKAESVTELLETMFQSAGPNAEKGSDFTVCQLLDDFSRDFSGKVDLEPEVEMTVRQTVAAAYDGLGDYIQAEPHARRAYELALEIFGVDSPQAAKSLARLGWLNVQLGSREKGREMLESAEEIQRVNLSISDEDYQRTLCCLAEFFLKEGKLDEAAEIARRVRNATQSEPLKPNHLWITNSLAEVYRRQGRTHEAEALFSSFVAQTDDKISNHPRTIEALHTACNLQLDLGKVGVAAAMAMRGYEIALRTLGP